MYLIETFDGQRWHFYAKLEYRDGMRLGPRYRHTVHQTPIAFAQLEFRELRHMGRWRVR